MEKGGGGGEGGIRTHERASAPYAISSRACSATPAPLRDPGMARNSEDQMIALRGPKDKVSGMGHRE